MTRPHERRALKHVAEMSTEAEFLEPDFENAICQCVYDLLPTLKDDYSLLLRRVDLEDTSIAQVAVETGITPNSVLSGTAV